MSIVMSGRFRGQKDGVGRDSIVIEPGRPVVLREDGWHYEDELAPVWHSYAFWLSIASAVGGTLGAFFS